MAEGEASLRRAVELRDDYLEVRSALLYIRQFRADAAPAQGLEEARNYGAIARRRAARPYANWKPAPADGRIRIGLVSGDLREHPVGYFLEGPLAQLARSRIEVFAYPTHHAHDALTERLRACCKSWSPIFGLADELAAQRIHDDGIQVLFDLAGHSAHGRLPVFAWRPAPVQVAWLGYFASTGVTEIDYLLADPLSVPAQHRAHFSETIWYLPETRICFAAPRDAPPVAPLPALRAGALTFGSFQNPAKIGDSVLSLWAQVMAALPAARLRLQSTPLADAGVRRQMLRRLQSFGIASGRVSLHRSAPRAEYLAAYGEVDVVLDTFPFAGGTTTCEALWMGVPTLTLAGDRLAGLQGASMLSAASLPQWIAYSPQQYVERACEVAENLPALAALRDRLRVQVLASPLFDAARFAGQFERAIEAMWRQQSRTPAG
jgi:predicted O-linked N-acetylglucosamine transferase (SPINDLY family)